LQRKSRLFQNEAQRGKRMKSNEHTISDLWNSFKCNWVYLEPLKKGGQTVFEEIIALTFYIWVELYTHWSKKSSKSSSTRNMKKIISQYIMRKVLKSGVKEKIL
jgi:hypothetical protein